MGVGFQSVFGCNTYSLPLLQQRGITGDIERGYYQLGHGNPAVGGSTGDNRDRIAMLELAVQGDATH